jgi:hypothetical protein
VTLCRHGHTLHPNNIYVRPDGTSICRDCIKDRRARHRAKYLDAPFEYSLKDISRFYARTEYNRETGCLVWRKSRDSYNYGTFGFQGRAWKATRWIKSVVEGSPVSEGIEVRHTCNNPPCVALHHLKLGTHADNMQDRLKSGNHPAASKTHCVRGHEFTEANTYITTKGYRQCKACQRKSRQAYESRRRQDHHIVRHSHP